MPINIGQVRPLNYGNAIAAGQQIKANRMRNQAMEQEQEQREDKIRRRTQAQQIRAQMATMPSAIDEMEKKGLFDEADKLRTHYIGQMKRGVEIARDLADGINENNYQQVRHDMIQSGAITGDMWPTNYSYSWWKDKVSKQKKDLEQFTIRWQENGATLSQDLLAADGDFFWKGSPFESAADRRAREKGKAEEGAGVGSKFKYMASDDNTIGSASAALFGGRYDPATQEFSGLDRIKAQKAHAVRATSSEIFVAGRQAGKMITHAQAVREAARRLRITIEDPNDSMAADPAGILPNGGAFTPPAPRTQ